MAMTYRQLWYYLKTRGEKELDQHVSIYLPDDNEYLEVQKTSITEENDVLDKGHIVIEAIQTIKE